MVELPLVINAVSIVINGGTYERCTLPDSQRHVYRLLGERRNFLISRARFPQLCAKIDELVEEKLRTSKPETPFRSDADRQDFDCRR